MAGGACDGDFFSSLHPFLAYYVCSYDVMVSGLGWEREVRAVPFIYLFCSALPLEYSGHWNIVVQST